MSFNAYVANIYYNTYWQMADNVYSTENVPIRCIMIDGVVKDTKLFEQQVIRIT